VNQNRVFTFEGFSTKTTGKVSDVWVYLLMRFQFIWWTETFWTFTANIQHHTFMSTYVYLKVTTVAEFLLTNVTCEPSAFIVWLQQMYFQLLMWRKTFWTVSTWVRLCTSVSTNMTLQMTVYLKQLPTVRTVIWSYVAVYMTFMCLQVAWCAETFVIQ